MRRDARHPFVGFVDSLAPGAAPLSRSPEALASSRLSGTPPLKPLVKLFIRTG